MSDEGKRIRLWSVVAEAGALATAGPRAKVHGEAGDLFAIGPAGTVVITGGVRTAEDLTVTGPFARLVEGRLTGGDALPVHVFARLPDGCLALGTARVTELARRRGVLQRAGLRLYTPLPQHLLDLARPDGPPAGTDWLDLLPGDPVGALRGFVADWYSDVPPAAPEPADGLPGPLRAFHEAAAGRPEVSGGALRVLPGPPAAGPDRTLVFGTASDGTFDLLIEPGLEDPPVYYRGLSDQPLRERERLSAYLMMSSLTRAAMDRGGGMAFVDRAQARRIVAPLRRVPLRPMRWPCARSRLYAGPDMVALVGEDDADWLEVYVGVRHREALRRLRRLGLDWASLED
ncbi:hypothetical protein Aca07nite_82600 [Actinoplanes capillaceus]|uniref:Uncharacterized protein n=1 Tax=Actinoplanes campanulatus TaxID=113559 RepID=A0ABQ3WXX8_9ACTN|nr:hypothetical protein [Actinoplanes capillaceus]GID50985.1 hypothetical protein Aca07nite_82600 [Actinoplanes capillaceus]